MSSSVDRYERAGYQRGAERDVARTLRCRAVFGDTQLEADRSIGAPEHQHGATGIDGSGELVEGRVVALDDRQVQRRRRRIDGIVEVRHDAFDLLASR